MSNYKLYLFVRLANITNLSLALSTNDVTFGHKNKRRAGHHCQMAHCQRPVAGPSGAPDAIAAGYAMPPPQSLISRHSQQPA